MFEERDLEFLRALWSRRVVVTYIILVVNILIYLLMECAGGSMNTDTLIAFGSKENFKIDQGEYWRFITPIFLHIGFIHLLFNSYALWLVGPQVEKLYGGARFLLLYLLTGMAGVAASYWYHPYTTSAGASGAIFGLFGVLLVFGFKYRSSIPSAFQQALSKGMLTTIGINLVIGWVFPFIDLSAHVGGLVAGAALAAVIPYEKPGSSPHILLKSLQSAMTMIVLACFFLVATHYDGPAPSFRTLTRNWLGMFGRGGSSAADFLDAIDHAQHALNSSTKALKSSPLNLSEAKDDLVAAIDKMNRIPSLNGEVDGMSSRLLALLQKQYELVQDVERAVELKFEHNRRIESNMRSMAEWFDEFNGWVERSGEDYGIRRKS